MVSKVVVGRILCHNGQAQAGTTSAISIHNTEKLADEDLLKQWLPVDIYVGGAEHAPLLYAHFWHKFLYDLGVVPTKEPFKNSLTKE